MSAGVSLSMGGSSVSGSGQAPWTGSGTPAGSIEAQHQNRAPRGKGVLVRVKRPLILERQQTIIEVVLLAFKVLVRERHLPQTKSFEPCPS